MTCLSRSSSCPHGETRVRIPVESLLGGVLVAYKDVAEHLSKPKASRAVANAVAQNPISYLIPCHRVIRTPGAFGGYGGGTARKKALDTGEGRNPEFQSPSRGTGLCSRSLIRSPTRGSTLRPCARGSLLPRSIPKQQRRSDG